MDTRVKFRSEEYICSLFRIFNGHHCKPETKIIVPKNLQFYIRICRCKLSYEDSVSTSRTGIAIISKENPFNLEVREANLLVNRNLGVKTSNMHASSNQVSLAFLPPISRPSLDGRVDSEHVEYVFLFIESNIRDDCSISPHDITSKVFPSSQARIPGNTLVVEGSQCSEKFSTSSVRARLAERKAKLAAEEKTRQETLPLHRVKQAAHEGKTSG